jgi:hypothetical protein
METAEPLTWRKSSYSTSNGGNCVEVATTSHVIAVRDSKDAGGPPLLYSLKSWQAFTRHLRIENAELDPGAERRGFSAAKYSAKIRRATSDVLIRASEHTAVYFCRLGQGLGHGST